MKGGIDLIRQLSQLCEALLTVQMDEQDRQNIFEHIQICVHNLKSFLEAAGAVLKIGLSLKTNNFRKFSLPKSVKCSVEDTFTHKKVSKPNSVLHLDKLHSAYDVHLTLFLNFKRTF